ncbi:polysaccharide lyase family 8 protein [Mycena maculata]|uniref:Polysaccharide lyase family 8 protein n=1 Tax=Mycena maculata TaxID=230809 RepID=A0AAD7IH24_9AGAR|nr:polysaccharide lyase family 8 protein [Mycena maculata]
MKMSFPISYIFYISLLDATTAHARRVQALTSLASTNISAGPTSFNAAVTTTSNIVSSILTVSAQPTSSINASTAQDIETIAIRAWTPFGSTRDPNYETRTFGECCRPPNERQLYLVMSSGQWPDVDYTAGCAAQRANWPIQLHWQRISTMAGAWHGGLAGAEEFVRDPDLRANISLAMGYWFANDFTNLACLDSGGTEKCPCTTPGLWNTNWYSNCILNPALISMSCLLLNDSLLQTELAGCTTITGRTYAAIDRNINGIGLITGANALDFAKIGIDQALLTKDLYLLTDAYSRVHKEVVIMDAVTADGIRPDGSFGQHNGILYNGNYGLTNDVVDLEIGSGGTQFSAPPASQTALATLLDGDRWMIYANVLTGVLHWDFSVLGRFIAFPTADNQATGSIHLNLTEIDVLGQEWNSTALGTFTNTLSTNATTANAGALKGNRMFYDNDYMVQRGSDYVTTLKMYSSRSLNTECTNLANPFGFHLSDGALRTYIQGSEYEDIAASMDWDLIPGITVDLNATPLNCAQTQWAGIENFVGGASDGKRGVSAMRYMNPLTKSLQWQKTWFFLDDDVQLVMVANISSATNASVVSVLDQRLFGGTVIADTPDDDPQTQTRSLWHGNVGYTFPDSPAFSLTIDIGEKSGNWSAIGTSTQPPLIVDLFAAWITHESLDASLSYTIYPGTDFGTFTQKKGESQLVIIQNDDLVSAVLDQRRSTVMGVFWATGGGAVDVSVDGPATPDFSVSANESAAFIFDFGSGDMTVSDPSQTLSAITLTLGGNGDMPWGSDDSITVLFTLRNGGVAGSSVSRNVYDGQ